MEEKVIIERMKKRREHIELKYLKEKLDNEIQNNGCEKQVRNVKYIYLVTKLLFKFQFST